MFLEGHFHLNAICYSVSVWPSHVSSFIVRIFPYWVIEVRNVSSATSGGRFAIRIFRVPMPAMFMLTVEISPFVCLYSGCPPVPVLYRV